VRFADIGYFSIHVNSCFATSSPGGCVCSIFYTFRTRFVATRPAPVLGAVSFREKGVTFRIPRAPCGIAVPQTVFATLADGSFDARPNTVIVPPCRFHRCSFRGGFGRRRCPRSSWRLANPPLLVREDARQTVSRLPLRFSRKRRYRIDSASIIRMSLLPSAAATGDRSSRLRPTRILSLLPPRDYVSRAYEVARVGVRDTRWEQWGRRTTRSQMARDARGFPPRHIRKSFRIYRKNKKHHHARSRHADGGDGPSVIWKRWYRSNGDGAIHYGRPGNRLGGRGAAESKTTVACVFRFIVWCTPKTIHNGTEITIIIIWRESERNPSHVAWACLTCFPSRRRSRVYVLHTYIHIYIYVAHLRSGKTSQRRRPTRGSGGTKRGRVLRVGLVTVFVEIATPGYRAPFGRPNAGDRPDGQPRKNERKRPSKKERRNNRNAAENACIR